MPSRNIARRLERLEAELATPGDEPVVTIHVTPDRTIEIRGGHRKRPLLTSPVCLTLLLLTSYECADPRVSASATGDQVPSPSHAELEPPCFSLNRVLGTSYFGRTNWG